MNHEEQIRRHHDGSIDIGFYARRAAAQRSTAKREWILACWRLLGIAARRALRAIAHRG
jgi:hypothetical protein